MNNTAVDFVLTIPIGSSAHRSAQELCQQQTNPHTAKQVYLNALAVHAVNFYFQCLEIETDLAASDIWNPAVQRFMDVADLDVKDIGKLECRWVAPGQDFVSIPAEVRSDRIGYVVLEMAESLKEAKLLGFVKNADREKVAVSELESIDNLLEYLDTFKPVNLSQWFYNVVEPAWETVENLFDSGPKLQWAFRSPQLLEAPASKSATLPPKRGKILNLERGEEQVALVVGLSKIDESEIDISVEVYPTNGQKNLPHDLQLIVLDDEGKTLMLARANKTDNLLFEMSGEPGEHFSVKVVLGDFSVTENFLI
ncbi:MAG TPA: hypothetical protein DD001_14740 [Microcoleaceae bacterium UBA10368]|jgi:Protein of unknown function (DUF1822).|nr:hypothetical protein [Microcoleaceae cyanobacterium UBA10368]HCV32931.1 hypothetical protein [Microcoleaceae cyanobacterium UBA9251]